MGMVMLRSGTIAMGIPRRRVGVDGRGFIRSVRSLRAQGGRRVRGLRSGIQHNEYATRTEAVLPFLCGAVCADRELLRMDNSTTAPAFIFTQDLFGERNAPAEVGKSNPLGYNSSVVDYGETERCSGKHETRRGKCGRAGRGASGIRTDEI